jgi:hypothetical protein
MTASAGDGVDTSGQTDGGGASERSCSGEL